VSAQHTPGQLPLAADSFRRWFEATGHWVYEYRAKAVRVWRERGIDGRADYTPALGTALQPWVDADPLPALVAKWNAERAAKQQGGAA